MDRFNQIIERRKHEGLYERPKMLEDIDWLIQQLAEARYMIGVHEKAHKTSAEVYYQALLNVQRQAQEKLAEAWDEGCEEGDGLGRGSRFATGVNPYRRNEPK